MDSEGVWVRQMVQREPSQGTFLLDWSGGRQVVGGTSGVKKRKT